MPPDDPPWNSAAQPGAAEFIERAMKALDMLESAPDAKSHDQLIEIVRSWLTFARASAGDALGHTDDGEPVSRH